MSEVSRVGMPQKSSSKTIFGISTFFCQEFFFFLTALLRISVAKYRNIFVDVGELLVAGTVKVRLHVRFDSPILHCVLEVC